jgi:alpha-acetolactate decarboxylase
MTAARSWGKQARMKTMVKIIATAFFFVWMLSPKASTADWPFNISVHGNFKRMLHSGDVSGKVALASIPFSAGTYGLGALAGLQGEILIWEGTVLVTPGESNSGSTQSPRADDQAALLIIAQVKDWEEEQVPSDMTLAEFERFLMSAADSRGIDIKKPFPFLLRGEITDYTWHVVTGAAKRHGSGAIHQQGHAGNRIFSGAEIKGKLVGFYSAEELEGVISHPGERLHIHYADDGIKISGHLDSFVIRKGARLQLPIK